MADLPAGTVTYLFTDIQGSTPLWERMPGAMKTAVRRHFDILQEAIAAHGGHVFKIVGDAIQVAFDAPLQAVEAAIAAQRALAAEPWGETGPIKVRMGIHTGPGELVDGAMDQRDYAVSHTLNRVSRIMSAGHGGQVLISAAMAELLHGQLLPEIQLKDLGSHYLKGLSLPEHIFQVLAPGLEAEFPPLVSRSPPRHNLPTALTPFVGREAEIQGVCQLLERPECRLVTLIGPGGIGKTRLALRTAEDLVKVYPQGAWWVSLVGVNGIDGLVPAIAEAVNFHFYSNVHPRQQLLDYLREKQLLLVLDNFEHLLEGAELLDEILTAAPGVKLLVTSREGLSLQEEWLYPLEGLEYPPVGKRLEKPLETYSAVQLYVQIAHRIRPGYDPEQEQTCIVRLCQLLEGMPLAIELAAAWVKTLPCERILAEIEKGLDILAARQRNIPERQRSIRAVFEHSWSLLSEAERTVLQRLSVFWGGFRLEAAERVAGARLVDLAALVDHCLLKVNENGRYHIHELLRQYAGEILKADPDARETVKTSHSIYYLDFLTKRETGMRGIQQRIVLLEIDEESDNIRAAWDWAVHNGRMDLIEMGLDSLYTYYWKRGRYPEGEGAFEEAGKRVRELGVPDELLLARLIGRQGHFRYALGPYEDAQKLLEASLVMARRLGNTREIAFNLAVQGIVSRELANFDQAKQFFEESLALYRQTGDQVAVAYVLTQLGEAYMLFGSFEQAVQSQLESLQISRQLGLPDRTAYALDQLGAAYIFSYKPKSSRQYYQEAMEIFTELNDPCGVAMALGGFGLRLSDQFNPGASQNQEALTYLEQSLALFREIGHRRQIGLHLWTMIYPLIVQKVFQRAKTVSMEAKEIGEEIDDSFILLGSLEFLFYLAINEHNFQEGRRFIRKALPPAQRLGAGALGKVVTFWGYLISKEWADSQEMKIRGLEMCSLGIEIMNPGYQNYSKELFCAPLEAELPPDVVAAAKERGKTLNLEEIIKEISAEVEKYA